MEAILATIIQYVSIWAPSLVAILGIVASVIMAIAKVKDAIGEMKNTRDNLVVEVQELIAKNEELTHTNKLLLDQITRIKDYSDNIKKGG